jgi:2-aminoadipate transaminase
MTTTIPFSFENILASAAAEPLPNDNVKRGKYDFAVAYPDPASLPLEDLVTSLQHALAEEGKTMAIYGPIQGYLPLREYVVEKLAADRQIHVSPDDIILGDGSAQPLHMVFETLIDPGDVVIVEDFVYIGTLKQLRRFRADIRGVACDEEGMIPEVLEQVILQSIQIRKPPKFIYTVPTFQNPQGWTMSLARRQALVALAQRYDIPIMEDDCYCDLRYEGQDVPAIHTLDDSGRVIYFSSFSKIIAPGMRMGYMTGPKEFLDRAKAAKSGGSVNTFAAFAIHRYAESGRLRSHIKVINDIQHKKRDVAHCALEEHVAGVATWSRPEGGLFLWIRLHDDADVAIIRDKVLETVDVGYLPGNAFAADGVSGKNYFRLCFGYNSPQEIEEGIALLAKAFRRLGIF